MDDEFSGPWVLYDYKNLNNKNEIKKWTEGLEKKQRIQLNQKLDSLAQQGPDLPPKLLPSLGQHIYKLRVKSNVQLRPMLCKGPINNEKEFTLLLGAIEVGGKLPKGSKERAVRNRGEIINDPKRRCKHERIT